MYSLTCTETAYAQLPFERAGFLRVMTAYTSSKLTDLLSLIVLA